MKLEISEDLSNMDYVKIQARVLLPLARVLREQIGEERARELPHGAIEEASRERIREQAEELEGSPLEKFQAMMSRSASVNGSVTIWRPDPRNRGIDALTSPLRPKVEAPPCVRRLARLIASAVKAVKGDMSNMDAFREALRKADFDSVRGPFKFGPNQHPVQDVYIREVVLEEGVLTNRIVTKAFTDHADAYVGQCKMQ